ncbi:MAG: hypothetical protein AUK44_05930 [Porphyromonadaceae bacterium CG2_30_38_12]|nr:MAG: hypothetical protein AUK44_05930 [Porphyromonadaceae bacterium CG2_30_38_12]
MQAKFSKIFLFFSWVIVLYSCENRPSYVLSQRQMTDFLIQLHTLDGALAAKNLGNANDSINKLYYSALLLKNDYTQKQFDSSLVWYTQHPKKFERIYTQVVEQLTGLDEKVRKGLYHPVDSAALRHSTEDIWPLASKRFVLSRDSTPTTLPFVIKNRKLAWRDSYKISFLMRMAPSNKSSDTKFIIRIHYANKQSDSVVCKTFNDSLLRRYRIVFLAKKMHRIDSITGTLNYYSKFAGRFDLLVDSMEFIRQYDAIAQDSIHKVVNLYEQKKQKSESKTSLKHAKPL